MTETTRDSIDIKATLEGPIGDVIARLMELQKEHPDGTIDVTTEYSYGDSFAAASLTFEREKTALEIEADAWGDKARTLQQMRGEAAAFERNGTPYPRAAEMETLRKELGFFAMAPMRGMLRIYEDEVIVVDMTRGGRRRDGSWVFRTLGLSGKNADAMYEEQDAQYRV